MKKSIFKSKTLWINVLMALAIIIPEAANLESLKIDREIAALAVLVINTILRFATSAPAGIKGEKK